MSRAFINKGEQWGFCSKSMDHCMYAEAGKDCRRTECEYYDVKPEASEHIEDKVVRRKKSSAAGTASAGTQSVTRRSTANPSVAKTSPAKQSAAKPPAGSGSPVKTKKAPGLSATTPAMRRRQLQALREHAKKMSEDTIE